MEVQALRKLTAKAILGGIPDQPPAKTTVPLFIIYGVAHGYVQKEGDYGLWTKLLGTFEAVRLSDGQKFQSPQAFLPSPYDEMIAQKLTTEGNDNVTFAFEVGVKRPDTGTLAYEYTCKPVQQPGAVDPLAELRQSITAALPAPATEGDGKAAAKK